MFVKLVLFFYSGLCYEFLEFQELGLIGIQTPTHFFERSTFVEQRVFFNLDFFGPSEPTELRSKTCDRRKEDKLAKEFNERNNDRLHKSVNSTISKFLTLSQILNRDKRSTVGLIFELINTSVNLFSQFSLNSKIHRIQNEVDDKFKTLKEHFSAELQMLNSRLCAEIRSEKLDLLEKLAFIHIKNINMELEGILYSLFNNLVLNIEVHSWKMQACLRANDDFAICSKLLSDQMVISELIAVEYSDHKIIFQILYKIPIINLSSTTISWSQTGVLQKDDQKIMWTRLSGIPTQTFKNFELDNSLCEEKFKNKYCLASSIKSSNFCLGSLLGGGSGLENCQFTKTQIHKNCIASHVQDATIIAPVSSVQLLSPENPAITRLIEPGKATLVQTNVSTIVEGCDSLTQISAHYQNDLIRRYSVPLNFTSADISEISLDLLHDENEQDEKIKEIYLSQIANDENYLITYGLITALSSIFGVIVTLLFLKCVKTRKSVIF